MSFQWASAYAEPQMGSLGLYGQQSSSDKHKTAMKEETSNGRALTCTKLISSSQLLNLQQKGTA